MRRLTTPRALGAKRLHLCSDATSPPIAGRCEITWPSWKPVLGELTGSHPRHRLWLPAANMRQGTRTDLEPSAKLHEVSNVDAAQMLNVSDLVSGRTSKPQLTRKQFRALLASILNDSRED